MRQREASRHRGARPVCARSWPAAIAFGQAAGIDPHGRALVDIELPDGRDVSRILLKEGLAQPWPNRGNMWCDRYTGTPARPRG